MHIQIKTLFNIELFSLFDFFLFIVVHCCRVIFVIRFFFVHCWDGGLGLGGLGLGGRFRAGMSLLSLGFLGASVWVKDSS